MSQSEEETKGFKVTDRRKFTADGELRSEGEDGSASKSADSPRSPGSEQTAEPTSSRAASPVTSTSEPDKDHGQAKASSARAPAAEPPRQLGLLDLLSMLATNALVQLGEVPDPASGETLENVRAAQDMISLLEMLHEKTQGNLDKNEEEALEQILYDLRMRFMAKANILKL